jgi:hypothetical protein
LVGYLAQALAWRVPALRKYRYIVYHDASLHVNTTALYDQVIELITGKAFVHPAHPYHKTIMAEAQEAVESQPRYARDRVDLQAEHYMREHLYTDDVEMRLTGLIIYDARDPIVQVCSIYISFHLITSLR